MLYLLGTLAAIALSVDDDPAKALRQLTDAGRYRFVAREGGAGGTVEAAFQGAVPLHVKADGIEFFRQGDVLVYQDGGQWRRTRTGTLSDPLRILGASAKVRGVRLPHEELARLVPAL